MACHSTVIFNELFLLCIFVEKTSNIILLFVFSFIYDENIYTRSYDISIHYSFILSRSTPFYKYYLLLLLLKYMVLPYIFVLCNPHSNAYIIVIISSVHGYFFIKQTFTVNSGYNDITRYRKNDVGFNPPTNDDHDHFGSEKKTAGCRKVLFHTMPLYPESNAWQIVILPGPKIL